MSVVYKAKDKLLNRFVAIKILKPQFINDHKFIDSFRRESQAAASMSHPNIVNIYDVGREGNIHYIVMELIEGRTLSDYIKAQGAMSYPKVIALSKQIAAALAFAHKNHIIHRDVKPHNVMITPNGTAKITDFGIAKAVNAATIVDNTDGIIGSVHYFSPEQARGGYVDEKSDIYSLGITIYEMATGKVPFDGENTVAIALMHLRDEITPPRCYFPDIPSSLEKIILKCTMKQPEQRYQSAAELILELQKVFLSPDGNYVYVNPLVDDSPTIQRNTEDIEKIRKSLTGTERKRDVEKNRSRAEEEGDEEEDYKEDASMNPKLEKLITLRIMAVVPQPTAG